MSAASLRDLSDATAHLLDMLTVIGCIEQTSVNAYSQAFYMKIEPLFPKRKHVTYKAATLPCEITAVKYCCLSAGNVSGCQETLI